jgi:ethanolamine utilization protein EutN
MQLGRVIGTVVATVKAPGLEGVKLLVIQPLDRHGDALGQPLVAADAVRMAGPGELVYFVAAREAAEAMPNPFVPVDHAIVGIVDAVEPQAGQRADLAPGQAPKPRARRGKAGQGADLAPGQAPKPRARRGTAARKRAP